MIDHGDDAVLHVDYKKHRLAMKVLEGNDSLRRLRIASSGHG